MITYDYIIVGAGIAGSCVAFELRDQNVLIIDKNEDIALGASGAAGAFLNPLLGKSNDFKDLVNKSLVYANDFYKSNIPQAFYNPGIVRIPKNDEDRDKFISYEEDNVFEYKKLDDGYFFPIGSNVIPELICKKLCENIKKKMSYEITDLNFIDDFWIINNELKCKNLILTTGASTKLIKEKYFNIRAVWGAKIDVSTTTKVEYNYHKECSVSSSYEKLENNKYKVSIGATHHRFTCDKDICTYCLDTANINKIYQKSYDKTIINKDTQSLLEKANDIIALDDLEVLNLKVGARACSYDYFPIVGALIDSDKTLEVYPYLKKGSKVPADKFIKYKNLFVLNGLGGRGFVLSPYLAKVLVNNIKNNEIVDDKISSNRLFKRWVRKIK
ncbi:MAG: FAD-dependent oxidoreductase [Campylobacteraceae bacterium]|nr:FAD-dependent oxidoreductase [Campylobacteraceae bacterium]